MSEWISVDERLPSEEESFDAEGYGKRFAVIVHGLRLWQRASYVPAIEGWLISGARTGSQLLDSPVTHWMPLPEPPNE